MKSIFYTCQLLLMLLAVAVMCACDQSKDSKISTTKIEPPSSFMDSPMLYNEHVHDKIVPCGVSVRKWIDAGQEGGEKIWRELSNNQWEMSVEEINKKTSQKHSVLLQFDKIESGVKLSRVVVDNDEYSPERVKKTSLEICSKSLISR